MSKQSIKNTNSQFAIDIAEGFYQNGKSLAVHAQNDSSQHGYIWIPPSVVNFSFATELLLKAVVFYDMGMHARGHKLFSLYQKLSQKTKNDIELSYRSLRKENEEKKVLPAYRIVVTNGEEKGPNSDKTSFEEIKDLLQTHSDSFENWRYIYEFGEEGFNYEFDFRAMDAFYQSLKLNVIKSVAKEGPKYGMKRK